MNEVYALAISITQSRIAELETECGMFEEELREGESLLEDAYLELDRLNELAQEDEG